MADITQDDEWVMERGIIAKMYMTPRQIKSYREGRWIEGIHYKKHSPKEGANKQVISSQADSLIKISRIWADFFPANTSNQPI